MTLNPAIGRLLELRRSRLAPVARAYHHALTPESAFTSPPTILLLGNHSSGKSSMINHLLRMNIQRTGIAPTDDAFTILYHSDDEVMLDGKALTNTRILPFAGLQGFGPGLVEHLQGKGLRAEILRHVRLIDSPGMIDGSNSDATRPYDFPEVVRWLASQVDLVLLFFDPEKPGTTGETIRTLTESLSGIDNKLRIVMNKMDLFEGMRDFARTYGALCWNLSRSLPTKDLPHIYTTVIPTLTRPDPRLPLDGFTDALRELERYIAALPNQRHDTVISAAIDESRLLHLRAVVVEHFRRLVQKRRFSVLLTSLVIALLFAAAASVGAHFSIDLPYFAGLLSAAVLSLLCGSWLANWSAQRAERQGRNRLDSYFYHCHLNRFAESDHCDDLQHDWQQVKPQILRGLDQVGLAGLSRVRPRQIRDLQHFWQEELPVLRRSINKD